MRFLSRSASAVRYTRSAGKLRNRGRLAFEPLEDRRLLAAGQLDPTFASIGLVTSDLGAVQEVVDVGVQPSGKLVVAGSIQMTTGTSAFFAARYNTDGTLDDGTVDDTTPGDSFGAAGLAVVTFTGASARAAALEVLSDGRLILAGTVGTTTSQFAVVRLNADGTLDNGTPQDSTPSDQFGVGGRVTLGFGGIVNQGQAIAIQPDGKIVVGGTAEFGPSPSQITFAVARLNPDGSLDDGTPFDTSPTDLFGDFGKRLVPLGSIPDLHTVQLADIALQPDGKIVAAGRGSIINVSGTLFALARINGEGNVDLSFDGHGIFTHAAGPLGSAATSVVVQPDGKIVAGGSTNNGRTFALTRYLEDGALDSHPQFGFGTAGIVLTDFSSSEDQLFDLLVQPDGKIVAAGMARNVALEGTGDFALTRYDARGQLDQTFGDPDLADSSRRTGKVVTDFGLEPFDLVHDVARAMVLTQQGLVVAGETRILGDFTPSVGLARYETGDTDQSPNILRSPSGDVARMFGFSLAAHGDILAVGDPEAIGAVHGLGTGNVGRAHTFDWTTGAELGLLVGPTPVFDIGNPFDPYKSPHYGLSVAIIDTLVAVGAPGASTVYFVDALNGQQLGRDRTSPAVPADDRGAAVAAVDHDLVVGLDSFAVGAPSRSDDEDGGVEVWRAKPAPTNLGAGIVQSIGFTPGGPTYGEAVAAIGGLHGETGRVLVGEPGEGLGGRAYLGLATGGWLFALEHPAPRGFESFGAAVAGFGEDALVGAPNDGVSALGAGAVYMFSGATGEFDRSFLNPSPDPQDRFGFAVTSLGNYVLIGAPNDDTMGIDAGAVYVFDGATGALVRTVFSPEPRAFANFGFSLVTLGADSFGVGAPSITLSSDGGAVYLFDIDLPVSPPPSGTPFDVPIRGVVWDDQNADGVRDPGEPGLEGREVYSSAPRGFASQRVLTDADGRYEFRYRAPGQYSVFEELPPGWSPTTPDDAHADQEFVDTSLSLPWATQSIGTLAVADLNADGRTDFITAGGSVLVYWDDPTAPDGYRPEFVFDAIDGDAVEVHPADVNSDGLPDLVIRLSFGPLVRPLAILLNSPTEPGRFMSRDYAGLVGETADDVVIADFNGDGHDDLAYTQGSSVRVLLQASGGPDPFVPEVSYEMPSEAKALAGGDLNNDGLADLVAAYWGEPDVASDKGFRVFLNDVLSPGTFTWHADHPSIGVFLLDLAVADVTGDGLAEVVATDVKASLDRSGSARVFLNDPAAPGTLTPGTRADFTRNLWGTGRVVVMDTNQDGLRDLLYGVGGWVILVENPSAQPGKFDYIISSSDFALERVGLRDFWMGDLDGDQRPDLVYVTEDRFNSIHVATQRTTFAVRHRPITITDDPLQSTPIADFGNLLDYDGDGVTDADEHIGSNEDANDDGVEDFRQPHVATLPSNAGHHVTLSAAPGTRLLSASTESVVQGGGPANHALPVGLFSFTLTDLPFHGHANLEIDYHSQQFAATTYMKFGPTADDPTPHWYEFLWDGVPGHLGAELLDDDGDGLVNRVVLRLRDLGLGDHSLHFDGDLETRPDGRIVDPGGPAIRLSPQVTSVVVNDGHSQRSMVNSLAVAFSEVVTIGKNAFELRRVGASRAVDLKIVTSTVAGHTVARLTFRNGRDVTAGSLRDGTYRLTIRGDRVRDSAGNLLDGDGDGLAGGNYVDEFFRLFGDTDGDNDVDRDDLEVFAGTFAKRKRDVGYLWYLDFNNSGRIWKEDLALFLLGYVRSRSR